jgi:CTP synthase (UTP-ammonia lyase)
VIEYVRNVLGFRDADHEESSPEAPQLAVRALSCSLVGQSHRVAFAPGSTIAEAYGGSDAVEGYYCNYGIAPDFEALLDPGGLRITAVDDEGTIRAVELSDHPFYVATLFIPQVRSGPGNPHPLVQAFVEAAARARNPGGVPYSR